jgi:hypothetical protein
MPCFSGAVERANNDERKEETETIPATRRTTETAVSAQIRSRGMREIAGRNKRGQLDFIANGRASLGRKGQGRFRLKSDGRDSEVTETVRHRPLELVADAMANHRRA